VPSNLPLTVLSTITVFSFLIGLFFWLDCFFLWPWMNSENKGPRYQQSENQRARERVSEAKRTGEKEDTIKKRKKIEISFLISRKKLRLSLTTTSYYRWLDSTTIAPRTSYFWSHSNAHVHVASLFFIAFIQVEHTVFIPLVYGTTNQLTYVRSWSFNNTWFLTSSDISAPWWLFA